MNLFQFLRRAPRQAAQQGPTRLRVEALEDRFLPAINPLVVGVDSGPPHVKVFNEKFQEGASFYAYDPAFKGGVRVALADVNGDGVADVITGAGVGGGSHVKVINGVKINEVQSNGEIADSALIASFLAFDSGFKGDIFVAGGDVNGDGFAEVIVSAGPGAPPHVKVFGILVVYQDGIARAGPGAASLRQSFFAFDPAYIGGVTVAAGDVNGDKTIDIIVGARSTSSHVKVINGVKINELQSSGQIADSALIANRLAFDPSFSSGILVGSADVDGDGRADVIVGPSSPGNGNVQVFRAGITDGTSNIVSPRDPISSFFAFGPGFTGGIRVGSINLGAGTAVVAAPNPLQSSGNGTSTGGIIAILIGNNPVTNLEPFGSNFTGGLFVSSYIEQDNL